MKPRCTYKHLSALDTAIYVLQVEKKKDVYHVLAVLHNPTNGFVFETSTYKIPEKNIWAWKKI
jgi:hypothetical protein